MVRFASYNQPWAILHYRIVLKRRPLFYIVNLVVPTSVITLVSSIGFFSPSNAEGQRGEKISLGITTLLAMSILLMIISNQMPNTSQFVPLMGIVF